MISGGNQIVTDSPVYFYVSIFLENQGEVAEVFSPIVIVTLALLIFGKKGVGLGACFSLEIIIVTLNVLSC